MHVGATLGLLRTHAGLSLRALAGQVGVSAAYLSRVEHGHDPAPTGERAAAIATALGLPPGMLTALIDEVRGDATDWLRATPTGRRLAAELRRRELSEAQLARVLAFVQQEFGSADPLPMSPGLFARWSTKAHDAAASSDMSSDTTTHPGLPLDPSDAHRGSDRAAVSSPAFDRARVLLGVRLSRVEDAWTLASLRWAAADRPVHASAIGASTAVVYARGPGATRVGVVICEAPVPGQTPDAAAIRVVWVIDDVPEGVAGALVLTDVARLADDAVVAALVRATTVDEVVAAVRRPPR